VSRKHELVSSGVPGNFVRGGGGCSANSVEDRGNGDLRGGRPLVRGSAQFANEWNRILVRLLRMYSPRNWEIGSALSKLRIFFFWGGAGVEHPKHPFGTQLPVAYRGPLGPEIKETKTIRIEKWVFLEECSTAYPWNCYLYGMWKAFCISTDDCFCLDCCARIKQIAWIRPDLETWRGRWNFFIKLTATWNASALSAAYSATFDELQTIILEEITTIWQEELRKGLTLHS
jgi:hypothetical protein